MNTCPRCTTNNLRVECTGDEGGERLWTLYYCETCNYSFRDTEGEQVLAPAQRKAIFQVNAERVASYPPVLPGMD